MKFEIYRTREAGRPMMRHQRTSRLWVGNFELKEQHHPDLRRMTRIAMLVDDAGLPVDGLPPLIDAMLLAAHKGWWSLCGYERIDDGGGRCIDYAQSWVMTPLDER